MNDQLTAKAEISIRASAEAVWQALTNPELIRQYMFGTEVITDWKVGNEITWKGEWQGRPYEDKGFILQFKPCEILQYSHFSPLGDPDATAENYHTVTIGLSGNGDLTNVALSQDNNTTEEARDHSQKNWQMMLDEMKKVVGKEK
jgi:uncharacterized protein YndB with AHSA1/START domain